MATRTWAGGTGRWTDAAQWVGNAVPNPDDTANLTAGTIDFSGATLDAQSINLAGTASAAPATLLLAGSTLGKRIMVGGGPSASFALIQADGVNLFGGTINATAINGQFGIAVADSGGVPGDLILLGGSLLNLGLGDPMHVTGSITSHGSILLGWGAQLLDSGPLSLSQANMVVSTNALVSGGTLTLGLGATLNFQSGAVATGEMVAFGDVGATLKLSNPAVLTGWIANFQAGDVIDLTATAATSAFYNGYTRQLTVANAGSIVATLNMTGPATGAMTTLADGSGGTMIEVAGSQTQTHYQLTADDRALHADVARALLTTRDGAPITGAGVRIGIISNSFDSAPGSGVDPATADALAGYLPLNAATGTSAVHVLIEGGSGDDNEGRAMAELVHQVAPGAELYFASGDGGLSNYADAVKALQGAGCQVIVDDLTYTNEPFFQNAGTLDQTVAAAVADGVNYFAAAGNDGAAAYQATYNPQSGTLPDGSSGVAQQFSNGADFQTVTLYGGLTTTLVLQWAAPWATSAPGVSPALSVALYDGTGRLVASSSTLVDGSGIDQAAQLLTITPVVTAQYRLVIQGPLAAGTVFKYVLVGSGGSGSTVSGTIDDPAANAGTLKGHEMLPGVNAVGAVDYSLTPAFGSPAATTTYYSATGASQFLFDSAGNLLAAPQTVAGPSFVAPVGAGTSVPGFGAFNGTSAAAPNAAAVAALMLQADPRLTPAQVSAILAESATPVGGTAAQQGAGLIDADLAVRLALAAACYAEGTSIATARGTVPVERLRVGDCVRTESGALRPVRWVGRRRLDCRRHASPAEVSPIRVQAHAMAESQPVRDLYLSPDHAVKLDGVLIPIRYLVNGATIAQVAAAWVTYFHVELDTHDVLLAEGLPAESFLDTGNRGVFENGGAPLRLHPDFARAIWDARACAPLLVGGPVVAAAQARLLARAQALGHAITRDPALAAWIGRRECPVRRLAGLRHIDLPAGARRLRLRSRRWVPAQHGEADARVLGVALTGLALDGVALPLDDPRLGAGWHAPERAWRWTDGDATIDVGGATALSFDLALRGRYWMLPSHGIITHRLIPRRDALR